MKRANTPLIFLGSCLAFVETTLVVIAGLTDINPTLIAVFALLALAVAVGVLAIMYWRDPLFFVSNGKLAHDLGHVRENAPECLRDLDWRKHPEDFTEDERRILVALSQKHGSWLTINSLRLSTRLPEPEFGDALASLMWDGLVRGGRTHDWEATLGLAERVGRGSRPIRDRRKAAAS